MTSNAVTATDEAAVIDNDHWNPRRHRVTTVAFQIRSFMRGTLAFRQGPIMTTGTSANRLGMVNIGTERQLKGIG